MISDAKKAELRNKMMGQSSTSSFSDERSRRREHRRKSALPSPDELKGKDGPKVVTLKEFFHLVESDVGSLLYGVLTRTIAKKPPTTIENKMHHQALQSVLRIGKYRRSSGLWIKHPSQEMAVESLTSYLKVVHDLQGNQSGANGEDDLLPSEKVKSKFGAVAGGNIQKRAQDGLQLCREAMESRRAGWSFPQEHHTYAIYLDPAEAQASLVDNPTIVKQQARPFFAAANILKDFGYF